ncbi:MAG: VWA domain-containing protein [Anaerolineales bacterium]|nr:VWA domain-containing protein [Anaerolineales bacterium]
MSGFGLLSPLLLGLSALAVPIILLYMLRLRRTDMPISSTFLWQQLVRDREANAPWQRLRPNWLLLLQLLILLALVLALARPFREVKTITTGRTVLLIDASASMNATDVDGKSRFQEAKDLALDAVNTLGSDDTMTVIRVAEVPEVLAAASRDRTVLRRAIREAKPSQGSADWAAALTLAAAGARGVDELQVVVLSDGGLPADLPDIPGQLRYVKVGEQVDNLAISALSTRALPGEPPQLFAQITNYGDQNTRAIFELHLDGEFYSSQFYDVPTASTINIIVNDLTQPFTELEARLSKPSNESVTDYLSTDNVAYAINTDTSNGNVLLMTEGNIFIERILSNLPGVNLTLGDISRGLPSGDYELVVFDGWLPPTLPDVDMLIIDPTQSTTLFDVVGESTATTIDPLTGGVLRDDDRTRFVNFADVSIRQIRTLDRIEWATTLVETQNGEPLVLAGEVQGRQVALFTFALGDSDLPLQITWPILMTRLMEWYRPQRAVSVDSLAPGQSLTIRPSVDADTVRIKDPHGNTTTLRLENVAEVAYADTTTLGFYEVEVVFDGNVVQRDHFAVNLFDARESQIAPVDEIRVQTASGETLITSTQREETGRRELWTYLAGLALLILGIEWWYYHRSLTRKPKALMTTFRDQNQPRQKRRWWQVKGLNR